MTKVTKKAQKEFLKEKLSTDLNWAINALLKVYEFQTNDEKNLEATTVINNVGFTAFDAEILSSFATQYLRRRSLSDKQKELVFKKIPRYWGQILQISDITKLNNLIVNSCKN